MNLPSDRMYARGFRRSFTPLSGCFSPFPHGTVHYRSSARIRAVTCCGGAFHPASVDLHATEPVWAPPLSLTTTEGISVDFFSSGYLDVSVPRVSLRSTMYSSRGYANAWVSPFGIAMVKDPLRLAWHFRGLARPSSPADAKASPACIPSLKSCFPAIQLDLLLHEQLESTILD